MRCEGGDTYLQYIKDVMACRRKERENMENYDFLIFDDVNLLVETVRKKDDEIGYANGCRIFMGLENKTKE